MMVSVAVFGCLSLLGNVELMGVERVTSGSQAGKECLYDGKGEETGVRTTI